MVLLLLFVCWDCFSFGWLVGFMLICIEFEGGLIQLCSFCCFVIWWYCWGCYVVFGSVVRVGYSCEGIGKGWGLGNGFKG
jgi:hypothetical protein